MNRDDRSGLGIDPDSIQKHGLPHTAQPIENEASCAPSSADTVQGNSRPLDDAVATGELRWRSSSAGGVRISARIHL
jgi:hypothetical protein